MQIHVRVKSLGKRKDLLAPAPYEIPDETRSLRQLLTALVETETDRYNRKVSQTPLFRLLTEEQIDAQAEVGKVGFGRVYSDRKADRQQAVEHAIRCWQDGLVRVFLDDVELTRLDDPVCLSQESIVTLIRLTFLAGRMW